MDSFREVLDEWMARTDTSQAELSRRSGVPQGVISRWLGRNPTRPTPANLLKIAQVVGAPYEDLLRMCGYLPASASVTAEIDPVQAELNARLLRLGTMLSRYPRAFWLAVLEGSERMARAGDVLSEPSVNPVRQDGFTETKRRLKRPGRGHDGQLPVRYPGVPLALAGAR